MLYISTYCLDPFAMERKQKSSKMFHSQLIETEDERQRETAAQG